jgi:hypothetical protein
MANSIYHELLGLPAVKYVDTIIKEYTSANAGGINSSAGARVKKLACNPSVPEVLRAACNAFADQQQLEIRRTKPKLTELQHTITDLVLHRRIMPLATLLVMIVELCCRTFNNTVISRLALASVSASV